MHIEVMPVKFGSLSGRNAGVGSEAILERVAEARERQAIRFAGCRATRCNAEMDNRMVDRFCQLDQNGRRLMKAAVKKFGLSARAYHRLLKVARTITDLAGEPDLTMDAVSEAIQYRSLDREAWRV